MDGSGEDDHGRGGEFVDKVEEVGIFCFER